MQKIDFYTVENRPWTGPRLRTAAIVGHTTKTSTKLWIRVRLEGKYHLLVSRRLFNDKQLVIGKQAISDFVTSHQNDIVYHQSKAFQNRTDRSRVFTVRSLQPGQRYYYYVVNDDQEEKDRVVLGYQTTYSFKTISTQKQQLTFALYSCHDPFKDNLGTQPWKQLYHTLNDRKADFVIGGGDQVYVDKTKTDIWKWLKKIKKPLLKKDQDYIKRAMLSWYQDVYRGYWGFPDVQKVFRSFPNYMIWDDHEIMDGWGSRTRDELSNELDTWYEWENKKENLALADKMFVAAKTVYQQYQHSHNPTTARNVYDYSISQKHADFYFLDMRGQREFDLRRLRKRDGRGANNRILGKDQIQRFTHWLDTLSSSNKLIYIISPVPVVHWTGFAVNNADILGVKDDFRDEWDHDTNHAERDIMLNMLFAYSHKKKVPIVFLSGDVHMSAVFRLTNKRYRQARVYQVTSSPITRVPAPSISNIILSNKGALAGKDHDYRYERLSRFHSRNFCIMDSYITDDDQLSLYADFYGESEDYNEWRQKRITLIKASEN